MFVQSLQRMVGMDRFRALLATDRAPNAQDSHDFDDEVNRVAEAVQLGREDEWWRDAYGVAESVNVFCLRHRRIPEVAFIQSFDEILGLEEIRLLVAACSLQLIDDVRGDMSFVRWRWNLGVLVLAAERLSGAELWDMLKFLERLESDAERRLLNDELPMTETEPAAVAMVRMAILGKIFRRAHRAVPELMQRQTEAISRRGLKAEMNLKMLALGAGREETECTGGTLLLSVMRGLAQQQSEDWPDLEKFFAALD